jgi:hypothetical protein
MSNALGPVLPCLLESVVSPMPNRLVCSSVVRTYKRNERSNQANILLSKSGR